MTSGVTIWTHLLQQNCVVANRYLGLRQSRLYNHFPIFCCQVKITVVEF
jgi:hypothetical protein